MMTPAVMQQREACWDDIQYLAVCEYMPGEVVMEFRVYAIIDLTPGRETQLYELRGGTGSCDVTEDRSQAQVYLHGAIKWDGCCDMEFDEQETCMLHFCGRKHATNLGVLMDRLYDLAAEMIPSWNKECAR